MQGKLTSDSCSGDLATLSLNVTQISSFSFFPLLLLFIMFAFFLSLEKRKRRRESEKERERERRLGIICLRFWQWIVPILVVDSATAHPQLH